MTKPQTSDENETGPPFYGPARTLPRDLGCPKEQPVRSRQKSTEIRTRLDKVGSSSGKGESEP